MLRNTTSRSVRPATVTPWRRISTIQFGPNALASERPSSGVLTDQIRLAEIVAHVPYRHLHAHRRAEMIDGTSLRSVKQNGSMEPE